MTDLRAIIDPKQYRVFAGPDWPSLEDIIAGNKSPNPGIAAEVADFVRMQQENYDAATLSGSVLAQANQQRQGQQFFDKQYTGSPCQFPWNTLGINANGDAYICESPSWLPLFIGNILDVDDIFDLLNSPTAQRIRQEILQGRYYYCNNRICHFFKNKPIVGDVTQNSPTEDNFGPATQVTQLPTTLILDFDYTCNLHCPSCRNQVINYNNDHVRRPIMDRIAAQVKRLIVDRIEHESMLIRWCGGEPFISDVYLDLLEYIADQNCPGVRHSIQTNGSYLQQRAELIQKLMPSIESFRISFDAATPATYQRTRRGGSWDLLLRNTKWLIEHCRANKIPVAICADFVVQVDNYREIPDFVKLCNELGIDKINWQTMWNWGTWPQEEFDQKNVYNPQHPLYADLCKVFATVGYPIN